MVFLNYLEFFGFFLEMNKNKMAAKIIKIH